MGRSLRTLLFLTFGFNALAVPADYAGTWKGFNETPTGLVALELTFSHRGTRWKGTCKFPEVWENTFPVRDLKVSDTNVSFAVEVETEGREMRLNGQPAGDKIEGTFEMFRGGTSAYTGGWSVKRAQPTAKGVSLTPRAVQPENNTSTQRPSERDRKSVAEIPPPTGPFMVGRTTFYWKDRTRAETLTDEPNDTRELMVTLWYPAQKAVGLSPAIYFPNYKLVRGRSSAPLPSSLKAHAFEQAPVARPQQNLPLILFSHGLGENTARYSAQLEELASYGYVIAAIDHTYDNQAVVFPDGRVARWSNKWEWAFEGEGIDREQFIRTQLRVMVEDVSFVTDQLNRLNTEPSGMFNGKLDLGNAGFFGHSLGGAIAPLVCQMDKRFKACLNQDGLLLGQVMILDPAGGKLERPFMFLGHSDPVTEETLQLMALTRMEYEEHDRTRRRRAYRMLDTIPAKSYIVSINGAAHSSFTDNPLLAANTLPAYRNEARTLQVIRDYTRAFFDKYLMSKNPVLVDGASVRYPEAKVDRYGAGTAP